MGVRHHEDLVAWQLSHELELRVHAFTARPPASRDLRFCDNARAAAASAPSNIAEGFWRSRHSEFSSFLNIARGSLGETQNHLRKAWRLKYISQEEFDEMWTLSRRALGATTKLQAYIDSTPDPPFVPQSSRHRPRR